MKRNCSSENKEKGDKKRTLKGGDGEEPLPKKLMVATLDTKNDIKWMQNACAASEKETIFELMRKTFEYRRCVKPEDILELFPRFVDIPELVGSFVEYF